jgi:sensor c-di-GMP phosphodiesterase-like protein
MTEVLLKKIAVSMGPMLQEDPALHIGINLAPQHFSSTRIIDALAEVTRRDLPASQLIFEITERGLVSDEDSVARTVMNGLSATGAKLAVDDFGTGYSSLNYLQRFPLDYLKVDKAFVDGISSATESSGLVDQIIRIAKSLGMDIIAEGVEQAFQADYLKAHGVHLAQGWHFGRPMPAHKFQEFVRQRNYAGIDTPVPLTVDPAPIVQA